MVYTALQRVSVNGTTYKIGETIQTSDAKALEADGLGHLMSKEKGIEDKTPPTPPKPTSEKSKEAPTPPTPPEDPKTDGSEGTNLGSESNPNAPTGDEDPEDITIEDPDLPPPSTSTVNLSSPEAVNLLSKKM